MRRSTAEWVVRDLRQTYSDYKAYWDALYDAAFGHYEALNKLPPVAYIRKLAGKLYQKVGTRETGVSLV